MKSTLVMFCLGTVSLISFSNWGNLSIETDADKKIADLEMRVSKLENIVYSTSQLAEAEANRRLENARRTLEHSRKLRKKGYLNESQLKNDQFALQQAQRELELAKATDDREKLGAELDVLNAEQALIESKRELEYIKKLESRGFSTQFDIQRCERNLRNRERQLELAKAKLTSFVESKSSDAAKSDGVAPGSDEN